MWTLLTLLAVVAVAVLEHRARRPQPDPWTVAWRDWDREDAA